MNRISNKWWIKLIDIFFWLLIAWAIYMVGSIIIEDHYAYSYTEPKDSLLRKVNDARISSGLKPLNERGKLNHSAFSKACDMLNRDYWSHESPDGQHGWDLMILSGYDYKEAGEILARNCEDDRCLQLWLESPTHKAQILHKDYKEFGVGRCENYTVIHFAVPK